MDLGDLNDPTNERAYGEWAKRTGRKASERRRLIRRKLEARGVVVPAPQAPPHPGAAPSPQGGGGRGGGGGGSRVPGAKLNTAVRRACEAGDVEQALAHVAALCDLGVALHPTTLAMALPFLTHHNALPTVFGRLVSHLSRCRQPLPLATVVAAVGAVSARADPTSVLSTLLSSDALDVVAFPPTTLHAYVMRMLGLVVTEFLAENAQAMDQAGRQGSPFPPLELVTATSRAITLRPQQRPYGGGGGCWRGLARGDLVLLRGVAAWAPGSVVDVEAQVTESQLGMGGNLTVKTTSSVDPQSNQNQEGARREWRVFKLGNAVSFERQLAALRAMALGQDSSGKDGRIADPIRNIVVHSCAAVSQEQWAWVRERCEERTVGDRQPEVQTDGLRVNQSQRDAVAAASSTRLSLIQGPPGTGKTYTTAVLVRHLTLTQFPQVLCCADSNTAADNLALALLRLHVSTVRLGRMDVVSPELESAVVDVGGRDGGRHKALIANARAVVCTCVGAGSEVLEKSRFACVVMDEASQCTEPVSLIPLTRGPHQVVLVGDHHQLPPTVLSRDAEVGGLARSLFARLAAAGCRPHVLRTQYRMHPAISVFPSAMFYRGEVGTDVAVVNSQTRPPVPGFDWPNRGWPVAFVDLPHATEEPVGSSYSNAVEAVEAASVVAGVVRANGVRLSDVGVITPYAAQVRTVTEALRQRGVASWQGQTRSSSSSGSGGGPPAPASPLGVEVASVDGFQGREKALIVVCTVRANGRGDVGFVADWRRVNVTLTRASRGVIVLGHRRTLECEASLWRPWLDWVASNHLELVATRGGLQPIVANANANTDEPPPPPPPSAVRSFEHLRREMTEGDAFGEVGDRLAELARRVVLQGGGSGGGAAAAATAAAAVRSDPSSGVAPLPLREPPSPPVSHHAVPPPPQHSSALSQGPSPPPHQPSAAPRPRPLALSGPLPPSPRPPSPAPAAPPERPPPRVPLPEPQTARESPPPAQQPHRRVPSPVFVANGSGVTRRVSPSPVVQLRGQQGKRRERESSTPSPEHRASKRRRRSRSNSPSFPRDDRDRHRHHHDRHHDDHHRHRDEDRHRHRDEDRHRHRDEDRHRHRDEDRHHDHHDGHRSSHSRRRDGRR